MGYQIQMQRYDNPNCNGEPIRENDNYNCLRGKTNCGGNCYMYFKYSCHPLHSDDYVDYNPGELRESTEAKSAGNVDISIIIAALCIVWFLGMIVGYLMYTRRKARESRERILTVTS